MNEELKMKNREWQSGRKSLSRLLLALCIFNFASAARAQPTRAIWPDMPPSFQGKRTFGPAVKAIQYLLRARGYKIKVDSTFGLQTETAVRDFQRRRKLKVDGIVGAQTWAALIATLKRGNRGDLVRAGQVALNDSGYMGTVDGRFGAKTEMRVKQAQRAFGLREDGVLGPQTWRYLLGSQIADH